MVTIKYLDREAFELSCEAIGTDWINETDLHENTIDVVLADNAKLISSFDTITVECDGLETSFDKLDYTEVSIV